MGAFPTDPTTPLVRIPDAESIAKKPANAHGSLVRFVPCMPDDVPWRCMTRSTMKGNGCCSTAYILEILRKQGLRRSDRAFFCAEAGLSPAFLSCHRLELLSKIQTETEIGPVRFLPVCRICHKPGSPRPCADIPATSGSVAHEVLDTFRDRSLS